MGNASPGNRHPSAPRLSVVVPAYDEAPNLERLLAEVRAALDPHRSPLGADRRRRRQQRRDAGAAGRARRRRIRRVRPLRLDRRARTDGGAARRASASPGRADRDARRRPAVPPGRPAGAARGARRRRPRLRHPRRAARSVLAADGVGVSPTSPPPLLVAPGLRDLACPLRVFRRGRVRARSTAMTPLVRRRASLAAGAVRARRPARRAAPVPHWPRRAGESKYTTRGRAGAVARECAHVLRLALRRSWRRAPVSVRRSSRWRRCPSSTGLGRWPLLEPDEGRNAEVAREMLELGRWSVPHFNHLPYLDKPACCSGDRRRASRAGRQRVRRAAARRRRRRRDRRPHLRHRRAGCSAASRRSSRRRSSRPRRWSSSSRGSRSSTCCSRRSSPGARGVWSARASTARATWRVPGGGIRDGAATSDQGPRRRRRAAARAGWPDAARCRRRTAARRRPLPSSPWPCSSRWSAPGWRWCVRLRARLPALRARRRDLPALHLGRAVPPRGGALLLRLVLAWGGGAWTRRAAGASRRRCSDAGAAGGADARRIALRRPRRGRPARLLHAARPPSARSTSSRPWCRWRCWCAIGIAAEPARAARCRSRSRRRPSWPAVVALALAAQPDFASAARRPPRRHRRSLARRRRASSSSGARSPSAPDGGRWPVPSCAALLAPALGLLLLGPLDAVGEDAIVARRWPTLLSTPGCEGRRVRDIPHQPAVLPPPARPAASAAPATSSPATTWCPRARPLRGATATLPIRRALRRPSRAASRRTSSPGRPGSSGLAELSERRLEVGLRRRAKHAAPSSG